MVTADFSSIAAGQKRTLEMVVLEPLCSTSESCPLYTLALQELRQTYFAQQAWKLKHSSCWPGRRREDAQGSQFAM